MPARLAPILALLVVTAPVAAATADRTVPDAPTAPPVSDRIDLRSVEPIAETYSLQDLQHYRWVLEDAERTLYEKGDEAARRELMRVAWARLDPTPTTPENEREEEHFRRVAYALREFPAPVPPWYDDRGQLLIRYGAPDSRSTSMGDPRDRSPNREVWFYVRLGLAFELEDPLLADRFSLVPTNVAGLRSRIPRRVPSTDAMQFNSFGYVPLGPTVPDFEAGRLAEKLGEMRDRGTQTLAKVPQIYLHDYGAEPLPVAFDAVSFASSVPGHSRLEVHTGLHGSDLLYERSEGLWGATLDVEAVAKTTDYREVARTRRLTHDRRVSTEGAEGHLVMDWLDLDLEPGSYLLALSVRDTTSGRIGVFQRPLDVPAFPEGELSISGIQTAFSVTPAEPGVPFRKGDLQVTPWPLARFPSDRDVHLYFEIYGLEQSPTRDTFYRVEMLLQPRDPKKRGWFGSSKGKMRVGVETSWEGRSRGPVARDHVALDTASLGPGTFDIRLRVTDEVGDAVAERTTAITISE